LHKKYEKYDGLSQTKFEDALEEAQKWRKKYSSAEEIPDNIVPKRYNFADL
jgi:hypothetical protein